MKRTIEWILAGIAILCIGGAAFIWIPQAVSNPPAISLWPTPAVLLVEVAVLGLGGFSGTALEPQQLSARWGFLVWFACGGLIALSVVGAMGVSFSPPTTASSRRAPLCFARG